MRNLRSLCRRLARNGKGFYAVLVSPGSLLYRIYHSQYRDMRLYKFVFEGTTIAECQQFLSDQFC